MRCLLLLLLLATTAAATMAWENGTAWHPESSSTYFILGLNQSFGYINLTAYSFEADGVNYTINTANNISLVYVSANITSYTSQANQNMSICGLEPTYVYDVIQNYTSMVYINLPTTNRCITYNTSAALYTEVGGYNVSTDLKVSVLYSLYNYTGYTYAANQSFDFYCFPLHTNCVPYAQNSSQWLFNWTNNYATAKRVYVHLNATTTGYTLKMDDDGVANDTGDVTPPVNLTATSKRIGGVVLPNARVENWFFIDTFYPYTDMYFYVDVEVG